MRPAVRYARNQGVSVGYAVIGDAPIDLVYLSPINNLDLIWENPLYARLLRALATFARVIVVDRRGTGVSDRYSPDDLPPLEDLVDDLAAVLDAVGSERAALFGFSDAGALCAMFATTRPERVSSLVLYATAACGRQLPGYPWQWSEEEWASYLADVRSGWGTREHAQHTIGLFGPSLTGDERMLQWWERYQRASASPAAILAQESVFRELDVRRMLPAIGVPTLVLHRAEDTIEPVGAGRYLAEVIADAEYVELDGADHLPWAGDQDAIVAETERFVTRVWGEESARFERVLATILFTDIVGSTQRSDGLGDRSWRDLRERHDQLSRMRFARYRGREVKHLGDGFMAIFDGPARGVRCAAEIRDAMARLGVEVRAGLHTGEVAPEGDDVSGIAVAIGARIGALADGGEVLVSSTVKDLVCGSGLTFADRGEHALKGVSEPWHLYALTDGT